MSDPRDEEIARLRETVNRLNRRCTKYERGLAVKVDEVGRKGWSLGRALATSAAAMYRARLEGLLEATEALYFTDETLYAEEALAREALGWPPRVEPSEDDEEVAAETARRVTFRSATPLSEEQVARLEEDDGA